MKKMLIILTALLLIACEDQLSNPTLLIGKWDCFGIYYNGEYHDKDSIAPLTIQFTETQYLENDIALGIWEIDNKEIYVTYYPQYRGGKTVVFEIAWLTKVELTLNVSTSIYYFSNI